MTDRGHDNTPTRVVELATNVDDASGEVVGRACETLRSAGALDVWTTAVTMKRGRPGVVVSVLAHTTERDHFAGLLLETTGSFGVRAREWDRVVLERSFEEVATRLGTVKLKVGRLSGRVVSVKPEFEDVERLAASAGVPLPEAMVAAKAAADAWHESERGAG